MQAKIGKIDQYILDVVGGALRIQGNWDASTNTPDISGTTTTGFAWIVSVAGTTDLGGITTWEIGDLAVKTASGWAKIDNQDYITEAEGDVRYLQQPLLKTIDTEILTLGTGYIHAFIKVGNSLFCGSRTSPPTITKIHNVDNMVSGGTTVITLTGKTYCESVTYSETRRKLYFLLVNEVLELDPETMAYTVFPLSISGGTGGSGAITTDGTHFYVVSYASLTSRVAKYSFNGVAFTKVLETSVSGRAYGHAIVYDKDSGYLYASGGAVPGWFSKISPTDLSLTTVALPGGNSVVSDDIAIAPDYVYGVLENSPNFKIVKVKKSDMSYVILSTGMTTSGFGCQYNPYDNCVYTVFNTTPGSYLRLDVRTGVMYKHVCPAGLGSLNEIQFDQTRVFFTTWTLPAKVVRTVCPDEANFSILKSDGTIGYKYEDGVVTADSFVGDGANLTNVSVGDDGEIQLKSGSGFTSTNKLHYDSTSSTFTEGNLKFIIVGNKVGVYKYA